MTRRLAICFLLTTLAGTSGAQELQEIVPTARQDPPTWRYTLDAPPQEWATPDFDDHAWKTGRAGFGPPGTPAVVVNTPWTGSDIWMRRDVTLPATGPDPSSL